jgi:hypothetical protein
MKSFNQFVVYYPGVCVRLHFLRLDLSHFPLIKNFYI